MAIKKGTSVNKDASLMMLYEAWQKRTSDEQEYKFDDALCTIYKLSDSNDNWIQV